MKYLISIPLLIFALLSFFMSSSIIFDLFDIRASQGNYVYFVVWANFICSLLYLAASYAILKQSLWAARLLWLSAFIMFGTFFSLMMHIKGGGLHESKTIFALIIRLVLSIAFALFTYFTISNKKRALD